MFAQQLAETVHQARSNIHECSITNTTRTIQQVTLTTNTPSPQDTTCAASTVLITMRHTTEWPVQQWQQDVQLAES